MSRPQSDPPSRWGGSCTATPKEPTRNLLHAGIPCPWTLGLCAAMLLANVGLLPHAAEAGRSLLEWLEFDRQAILQGQLWRLITGNLVHWSVEHFLLDVGPFLIVGLLYERPVRRQYPWFLLGSALAIGASVLVFLPAVETYRGLSGVDSGQFALAVCVELGLRGASPTAGSGWLPPRRSSSPRSFGRAPPAGCSSAQNRWETSACRSRWRTSRGRRWRCVFCRAFGDLKRAREEVGAGREAGGREKGRAGEGEKGREVCLFESAGVESVLLALSLFPLLPFSPSPVPLSPRPPPPV